MPTIAASDDPTASLRSFLPDEVLKLEQIMEPLRARYVELERDHIIRALETSNWVVGGRSGAAERLGMKRTSLVYRMRKLRIKCPARLRQSGDESRD